MAAIALERIGKRFGTTVVADDLSLAIDDGEFFVFLGPSGGGKSTLLHMIAGVEPPTSGRIRIGEVDVTDLPPQKRDVAMVFQSYALYPHLDVAENLAFPLRNRGMSRQAAHARALRVASTLGIEQLLHRRPRELSGGQRQRVALGRALIRAPAAFLMDDRSRTSTPRCVWRSGRRSSVCTRRTASPRCSSRTTRRKRSRSPTAWPSSRTAESSNAHRRRRSTRDRRTRSSPASSARRR
jgi:ABC-type polar amino acid transport system ATPase subunit